ncbi:unnamed protein product, partial [Brassica oleracea var. botrytis]
MTCCLVSFKVSRFGPFCNTQVLGESVSRILIIDSHVLLFSLLYSLVTDSLTV